MKIKECDQEKNEIRKKERDQKKTKNISQEQKIKFRLKY